QNSHLTWLGVDEEDADGCQIYYPDNDLDGSGPTEEARCLCEPDTIHNVIFGGDCNDNIPTIGPMTPESCNDADDDCDGLIDDGCDDDQDGWCDALMTVEGSPAVCPNGGGDCVDLSALVNPGVQEIPGNFLDDNCDGVKIGDQGPAVADCTGEPCTGQSNEALLCALELCFPGYNVVNSVAVGSPTNTPTDQAWNAVAHYGSPTNSLAPKGAASYVLLSSGLAVSTQHNTILGGGPLPDPYGSGKNQTYDNVEIKIALKAPEGVTGFTVDYIFMSAEYHEFVGKTFNDRFYMVLTAPDTTNGDPEVVNFTECTDAGTYYDFIQDGKKWCYIAVNTAFSEPCPGVTDLSGTGYACPGNGQTDSASTGSSTGWLQTSWPIKAGETFELVFHIHDTADGKYDSTVILDNFRWETQAFNKGTAASFN
ncbi:MAG TPA: hypothetical protein EYN06_02595, partial [Myxococcales bacterium]|nr:hypothetical protein [Myxococcales bacterium]